METGTTNIHKRWVKKHNKLFRKQEEISCVICFNENSIRNE